MTGSVDLPRGVLRPLSVAPMMERTDRHFRFFVRALTRRTLLYTEMVTARAILRGDRARLLAYHADERPLALQLGGDDPHELTACARIAHDLGFDEVNLNAGCPSDRVQHGRFGACLMDDAPRVAECVAAMRDAAPLPVTVKHRIGVDERDSYDDMLAFVDTVASSGCDRFTVHARKAWLSGLSPRENREIPPLRYDDVHRLKRERSHLVIEINGGLLTLDDARAHLAHVDAAMVGRAAWDDPFAFAAADRVIFGESEHAPTRREAAFRLLDYLAALESAGESATHALRVIAGLLTGRPGSRAWRRAVSQVAAGSSATRALAGAIAAAPAHVLDERG